MKIVLLVLLGFIVGRAPRYVSAPDGHCDYRVPVASDAAMTLAQWGMRSFLIGGLNRVLNVVY